jgi:hypothetical protein
MPTWRCNLCAHRRSCGQPWRDPGADVNARRGFHQSRPFSRPARSAHELRADWLKAIELAAIAGADAKAMGEGAQAPPSGQPGVVFTRFAAALRDLSADNFPLSGMVGRVHAAAFLTAARAFAEPVGNAPEVRSGLGGLLAALAGQLDGLMDNLRRVESEAWRRSTGERDD